MKLAIATTLFAFTLVSTAFATPLDECTTACGTTGASCLTDCQNKNYDLGGAHTAPVATAATPHTGLAGVIQAVTQNANGTPALVTNADGTATVTLTAEAVKQIGENVAKARTTVAADRTAAQQRIDSLKTFESSEKGLLPDSSGDQSLFGAVVHVNGQSAQDYTADVNKTISTADQHIAKAQAEIDNANRVCSTLHCE